MLVFWWSGYLIGRSMGSATTIDGKYYLTKPPFNLGTLIRKQTDSVSLITLELMPNTFLL